MFKNHMYKNYIKNGWLRLVVKNSGLGLFFQAVEKSTGSVCGSSSGYNTARSYTSQTEFN